MTFSGKAPPILPEGWLRTARQTLGQTQSQVAEKLGIKRQAYANFETGEVRATISLATLRRAAQALDCDLIYFLTPKTRVKPATTRLESKPEPAAGKHHRSPGQFIAQPDRSADELPLQLL